MNSYRDYRAGFRREHTVGAEKGSGTHGAPWPACCLVPFAVEAVLSALESRWDAFGASAGSAVLCVCRQSCVVPTSLVQAPCAPPPTCA